MKRIFIFTLFFTFSLANSNLAYSIAPDVFIQSTVNRASQVLSENLSKEDKINISAGMTGVISNVKWQNEMTGGFAETESSLRTPFYLYASYSVSEKLALGLSVYTPYGSSVEWPTDWAGSHLINNIDLQAIYIQPLISYKITDNLSVGGGPIFVTGSVNFNRNITTEFFAKYVLLHSFAASKCKKGSNASAIGDELSKLMRNRKTRQIS